MILSLSYDDRQAIKFYRIKHACLFLGGPWHTFPTAGVSQHQRVIKSKMSKNGTVCWGFGVRSSKFEVRG